MQMVVSKFRTRLVNFKMVSLCAVLSMYFEAELHLISGNYCPQNWSITHVFRYFHSMLTLLVRILHKHHQI